MKNSWGEPTAARLVEALKDPNPDVQNTAYDLLCAIWHEPTIDRLQLAAHDHDPQIQAAARFVLGDSWDETYAIPSLLEMYFSNNEEEKQGAIDTLQRIGWGQLTPARLLRAVADHDMRTSRMAEKILSSIWGEPTPACLIDALRDDDPDIVFSATMLLGARGHQEAIRPLLEMAGDRVHATTRAGIATSLESLGVTPFEAFVEFAESESDFVIEQRRRISGRIRVQEGHAVNVQLGLTGALTEETEVPVDSFEYAVPDQEFHWQAYVTPPGAGEMTLVWQITFDDIEGTGRVIRGERDFHVEGIGPGHTFINTTTNTRIVDNSQYIDNSDRSQDKIVMGRNPGGAAGGGIPDNDPQQRRSRTMGDHESSLQDSSETADPILESRGLCRCPVPGGNGTFCTKCGKKLLPG